MEFVPRETVFHFQSNAFPSRANSLHELIRPTIAADPYAHWVTFLFSRLCQFRNIFVTAFLEQKLL